MPSMQVRFPVAYLSIVLLKKLNVMIPDFKLTGAICYFIAKVYKSKVAVKKTLDENQVLLKSMIQQYLG